ncbi:MAG: hypothetical protein KDJ38_13035 [Gammaproteobacteria bacterium]|nr:hypothetical protein [Gammaproteobacteria bacterium]
MDFFWENGFASFLILTVVLGGAAAYMSGRAVARQWKSVGLLVFYCALLALAVKFLHFALFDGPLLSLKLLLIDFSVVLLIGLLGYRITRVNQMVTQYRWLYQRSGLFWWRNKPGTE